MKLGLLSASRPGASSADIAAWASGSGIQAREVAAWPSTVDQPVARRTLQPLVVR